MKCDIISAGVGGQGVLFVSAAIAASATKSGLHVKHSEEHGMAQRGGSVVSHVRVADRPIHSGIIPRGRADLIVSMEPLETLRYLPYLAPDGTVVSSSEPTRNFANYPDLDEIRSTIRRLPRALLIDAESLARQAGLAKATNMVMVGAASVLLPVEPEMIEAVVREGFAKRGRKIIEANLNAFRAGREAVTCVPT
jgi:indolepyruvate ferredoxin oxidoreductase beta subunit